MAIDPRLTLLYGQTPENYMQGYFGESPNDPRTPQWYNFADVGGSHRIPIGGFGGGESGYDATPDTYAFGPNLQAGAPKPFDPMDDPLINVGDILKFAAIASGMHFGLPGAADLGAEALGSTGSWGTGAGAGAGATGTGAAGMTGIADMAGAPITGGVGPAVVGGAGTSAGLGSAAGSAAGTAISRILDGTASTADWLSVLGPTAATALGIYGSNRQAGRYDDLANRYLAMGEPFRARAEASMQPGFDPMSIPGYRAAVDDAMDTQLRGLSAVGGNPFGQPGGLIEAQKKVLAGTALPAITNYQNQNISAGGLANLQTQAPGLQSAAIGQQGNVYNAIGAGISDITNPRRSLADVLQYYGSPSFA